MEKPSLLTKTFTADLSIVDGERAVVAVITTRSVDRDFESLNPQGMNSKDYERNPVILYSHNYDNLPVGKCVSLKRGKDQVTAKIVFADRPADYPADQEWLPSTLYDLYRQRILSAFSVGLLPIEVRQPTPKDIEELGDTLRRVISKWNLYEVSVCSVPCNPDAVAIAVGKGILTPASARKIFDVDIPATQVRVNLECEARAIELAESHVDPDEWDGAIHPGADNSDRFLGIDTMQPEGSDGHWLYPIITMANRVNRKAVDSVLAQARKAGHETIATAAKRIAAACDTPNAPKSIHLVTRPIDIPAVTIKRIHRTIEQPRKKLDIEKMVRHRIQKLRGRIYAD